MNREEARKIVKEAVDKYDPIGLLKMGCPRDEYNIEIKDIVANISKCENVKELQKLVYKTFIKWFSKDIAGENNAYEEIARHIWQRYHNRRKR